jgi:membrane-bound lytic murein transglycosylase
MFTGGIGGGEANGGIDLETLKSWATANPDVVSEWLNQNKAAEPPPE